MDCYRNFKINYLSQPKRGSWLFACVVGISFTLSSYAASWTVLDAVQYKKNFADSRAKVQTFLSELKTIRRQSIDSQIATIVKQLANAPYLYTNSMGEGDWQPTSKVYHSGAVHINQNPVYRLDGFDCQTFVQVAMALLYSNTLKDFDTNIIKIAYGAAGNPQHQIVRNYNRNHFIEADFNPINQQHGWLSDATSGEQLVSHTKIMTAVITRQQWFLHKQRRLAENVQVLSLENADSMVQRLKQFYANLPFAHFKSELVSIRYLPKEHLVITLKNGKFQANANLFDRIPTPSIAEIVRDPQRWQDDGMKIKELIGSELTVSHLGLLYRQNFKQDELIYQKITCDYQRANKVCEVKPVFCMKKNCHELMFAHASRVYPAGFYFYPTHEGKYVCTNHPPPADTHWTMCNRVMAMPFYDYLTDYQLGYITNMQLRSVVGVHVEKLRPLNNLLG
jgi:hypothetical protein